MQRLRDALFAVFVIGLGLPSILPKTALSLLSVLWLWDLRWSEGRAAIRWPLIGPVLALSAATILSALLSGHPGSSLLASRGLLLAAALYVTVNALRSAEAADRFLARHRSAVKPQAASSGFTFPSTMMVAPPR